VDGVSFTLHRGETLGLVGESGCGKSTTGRSLVRLVEPTSGRIVFDGEDVGAMDDEELRKLRRRVQIVFQDPYGSLNPRLTVGAMLDEVLRVHRLHGGAVGRRRRVVELLEQVGLSPGDRARYPHEFSGGQRQRLGIARALAVEPELIVLDEPVSALDVSVQAQVVNLLTDLQKRLGLTYLFIAHDLGVIRHVSDRVAVMYLGRIVERGAADAVYESPAHPYTRALLTALPGRAPAGDDRRQAVLHGELGGIADPGPGCPFYPRCPHPSKDAECQAGVPALHRVEKRHFAACVKVSSYIRTGG
jgi:oligopeptide/dipeptide ABC transporter ATP-binding protein